MGVILVALVLVAAAMSIAFLTRSSFGVALPSTIFAIALLLYAFSLVNALFAGLVVVVALLAALVVTAVVRRGPRETLRAIPGEFTPALVLFLVFIVGSFLLTRHLQLGSWDEFTHWGASVKAVVLKDAIAPHNSIDLAFRSYPPAMTMFEYFTLKLSGGWNESTLFWAYQLMFASLFMPFIADLGWRPRLRVVAIAVIMALTPVIIFNAYQVVLVDPYLGLLFGYGLALVHTGDTRSRLLWLRLSLALGMLVLTKDAGFFLAAIVAVLFLVKAVRERRDLGARARWASAGIAAAAPVLAIAIAYLSWKTILSVLDVPVTFAEPIDLFRLSGLADGTAPAYWTTVLQNFWGALTGEPISYVLTVPFSHVAWFVFAGLALVALELVRGHRWGTRLDFSATVVVLVGALAYTVGLLVLYLFRFGNYEALQLASFGRYLGTYWVGVLMFLSLCAIRLFVERRSATETTSASLDGPTPRRAATIYAIVWLAVILAFTPARTTAVFLWTTAVTDTPRASIAVAEKARAEGISDGDRVWVIDQYSTGYEYWTMRYELMPTAVNDGYWSLGAPKDKDDVWTTDLTVADWSARLAGYDYVLVERSSRSFVDTYGSLFADPSSIDDGVLFAVSGDASGVTLTRVH